MRGVCLALTMLVACWATASAAAFAAVTISIIVTDIIGCIGHGIRDRPRSVELRNHHVDERASDHSSCGEHTSFDPVRGSLSASGSWPSRSHPRPTRLP